LRAGIASAAPTRSGKGVSLVLPTLLSWTSSAVFTTSRVRNAPKALLQTGHATDVGKLKIASSKFRGR
jgi:hypothetical protein